MKKTAILLILIVVFFACKSDSKEPYTQNNNTIENAETLTDSVVEVVNIPLKKSNKELKEALISKGYQLFDYVDDKTQDTILMQQYFIAFLKRGPTRVQNEEEIAVLQTEHLAHLSKMYELGYADISGPFGDDSHIRGITIYNVPTLKMADSLANADPMVKAGHLEIDVHPWWAAKGFYLR